MRERKRAMPRKKKALRRLGLLALALAALLVLGDYGFTVPGAHRVSEVYYQMGKTQMVNDFGDLGLRGSGPTSAWLTESGKGLLFSVAHFNLRSGWQPGGSLFVPAPAEGCPLSCGVANLYGWDEYRIETTDQRTIVFGRVNDPTIVRVRLEMEGRENVQMDRDSCAFEWKRRAEDTLFLEEPITELYSIYQGELIGYDEQGNEVARTEIVPWLMIFSRKEYGGKP